MEAQLLTNEEIVDFRRVIRKNAGNPNDPNYRTKFRDSIEQVWVGSPLKELVGIDEFRKMVLTPTWTFGSHGRKKKEKRERTSPNVILDNEQRRVVFASLVRSIANACGRIPDDCIMDNLGMSLGYTYSIWDATKKDLETRYGYIFTPIENGYKVELPSPEKRRMMEIELEMTKLRNERENLKKKLEGK